MSDSDVNEVTMLHNLKKLPQGSKNLLQGFLDLERIRVTPVSSLATYLGIALTVCFAMFLIAEVLKFD